MQARQLLNYLFETDQQSLLDEESLVMLLPADHKIRIDRLNEIENTKKKIQALQKKLNDDTSFALSLSLQHTGITNAIRKLTKNIDKELKSISCDELNDDGVPCYRINGVLVPSLRWCFLTSRRTQLQALDKSQKEKNPTAPAKLAPSAMRRVSQIFLNAFDNCKKFVDGIDDLVSAIGRIKGIPAEVVNVIGPFLNGVFGIIVQGTEAARGLYTAIKNLRKKNPHRLRNNKVIANFLIFGAGTAGFGMGIAYVIATAGVFVAGSVFLNMLIPAMVGLIAAIGLVHNVYRYRAASEETEKLVAVEKEMQQCESEIQSIKQRIDERHTELHKLRECLKTPDAELTDATKRITQLTKEDMDDQNHLVELESKLEIHKTNLAFWNHKRSSAIRNTAFRSIEVLATIIIITGLILSTAAIVGAVSAATFGAAMIPSAIIFTGVGLGFALKLYEYFDKKRGYPVTNFVINTIKNKFADLFSLKRTPDLVAPKQKQNECIQMEKINMVKTKSNMEKSSKLESGSTLFAKVSHKKSSEENNPLLQKVCDF